MQKVSQLSQKREPQLPNRCIQPTLAKRSIECRAGSYQDSDPTLSICLSKLLHSSKTRWIRSRNSIKKRRRKRLTLSNKTWDTSWLLYWHLIIYWNRNIRAIYALTLSPWWTLLCIMSSAKSSACTLFYSKVHNPIGTKILTRMLSQIRRTKKLSLGRFGSSTI